MKKIIISILIISTLSATACTNMSPTTQGTASGAVLGAAAGVGVAALSGGVIGVGALVGAGVGALTGGVMGSHVERQW